jgi:hypothetical protein
MLTNLQHFLKEDSFKYNMLRLAWVLDMQIKVGSDGHLNG